LLQTHLFAFLKYTVLTEVQTRLLVDRNSNKSGLTTVLVKSGPSAGNHLVRGIDSGLFLQVMNLLREDELNAARIPADVLEAFRMYLALLEEHRYLDYSQILYEAVRALEGSEPESVQLRAELSERVRFLVVDEYQDVNPVQERLIQALVGMGASLCVVGD